MSAGDGLTSSVGSDSGAWLQTALKTAELVQIWIQANVSQEPNELLLATVCHVASAAFQRCHYHQKKTKNQKTLWLSSAVFHIFTHLPCQVWAQWINENVRPRHRWTDWPSPRRLRLYGPWRVHHLHSHVGLTGDKMRHEMGLQMLLVCVKKNDKFLTLWPISECFYELVLTVSTLEILHASQSVTEMVVKGQIRG